MDTLPLKLTVTPLLILTASLVSRRWGEIVGGWLVGLPLTSAPVCFFLALDQGMSFAAAVSLGCLAGAASEAGFSLGYSIVARHFGWKPAILSASFGFAVCGAAFSEAALPLWSLVAAAAAALAAALRLMPRLADDRATLPRRPRWDIAARMAVATGLVLGLTALAPYVGGRLSGLLATYPVFAAVLTAFSHHGRGPAAAIQVLRGLLIGLYAFIGFFAVLASTIERIGIAASFAAATVVALAIQGCSLWLMGRRQQHGPAL
ncbi:MAG TPA: hypothetical protein VK432_07870 [Stellaceae bacterium]|nr:hypothetical protein [Stellaceae bacterium]